MASNLLGRSLLLLLTTYISQRVFSDDCGGTFTSDTGILTSPNYPNGYNKTGECVWIIRVNEGDKVCMTFINMSLDLGHPCLYTTDFVEVRDGGNKNATRLYHFCANERPVHVHSSANVLFVRFVSNGEFALSGFRAFWDVCFLPTAYNGTLNKTTEGLDCLRWDEQYPTSRIMTTEYLPEKNLTAAENYCRDPDNSGSLWCYVEDRDSRRFQDCDINPCGSTPCQNDAGCHNYETMYTCICQPGWTGKNCDVDIDDCDPNLCKNDGICLDGIHEYSCWCQPEWTGNDCNIRSSPLSTILESPAASTTISETSRAFSNRHNVWIVILLFWGCEII